MPRQRDPKRDEAFELYRNSNGDLKLKDIAERLNTSEGTVRGWKTKDKWDEKLNGALHKKIRNAPNEKSASKVPTSSDKQRRRSGNPHPSYKFPNHNSLQTKHGLYSKFLHVEQMEIIEATTDMDLPDYLWFHIQLSFSSIVRMQKIMLVENEHDHLKEEISTSWGDGSGSESHKVSFAFERYESYIRAQARAMAEFRNLTKQFMELTNDGDERRLKLEQMQLGIDKTKAEIDKLNGLDDEATINGLDQLTDAIRRSASMFKGDE